MNKRWSKNIKIVDGEVKFVKLRVKEKEDEENKATKVNFFTKKTEDKQVQAEQRKVDELKERQKEVVLNNKMMSRADLVHLLEDSIEKSLQPRRASLLSRDDPSRQVGKVCATTKKFIQKKATTVE